MAELPNLEDVKAYCRVDTAEDNLTLNTLLIAAREYVQQATGLTFTDSPTAAPSAHGSPSGMTAGIALCHMLGAEGEPRGEVYTASVDRTMSGKLFAEIEAIIRCP